MSFIAWWGAGLSTFLAAVRVWEMWRDRFQIDIGYNFTSNPDIGNEIIIRNLSARPAILSYWQVLYGSGTWPFRKYSAIDSELEINDIRLEPHSSTTLSFSEESNFSSSHSHLKGRKIYMRLCFAGKRSILRQIYG